MKLDGARRLFYAFAEAVLIWLGERFMKLAEVFLNGARWCAERSRLKADSR